jgi:hydroxymethylbilane synthase
MGRFLRVKPKPTIRISARKSDLARLQAYLVGRTLSKKNRNIKIEYNFRESLGDRNLTDALWQMPEKGVFTQDFKDDLLKGRTDLVVHSWKDLPIEENPDTLIAATLDRQDERDVFLFKREFLDRNKYPSILKVYSSSPRREFNLTPFFSWSLPFQPESIAFTPVRGNIQTRVLKTLESSDIHGIIVAKAALDRLLTAKEKEFSKTKRFLKSALKKMVIQVIPLSQSPTAAAQGALAIEVLKTNTNARMALKKINNILSFNLVNEERVHFKKWGGGCHQKMGVTFKQIDSQVLKFERGLDQTGQFVSSQEVIRTGFGSMKTSIKSGDILDVRNELEKITLDLIPYRPRKKEALILTKGNLLAEQGTKDLLVWTSGLETWKQMAMQGYWVLGSYDSCGEADAPDIEILLGKKLNWTKLTHRRGKSKPWAKTRALYQVKYENWDALDRHKNKSHFYWSHGDLFVSSVKRFPWLKKKKHVCGLGSTLNTISKIVMPKNIIPVYNYKEWKKKWIL